MSKPECPTPTGSIPLSRLRRRKGPQGKAGAREPSPTTILVRRGQPPPEAAPIRPEGASERPGSGLKFKAMRKLTQ